MKRFVANRIIAAGSSLRLRQRRTQSSPAGGRSSSLRSASLILELWAGMVRVRIPFELEIFHTLEEAEKWLGVAESKVA